MVESIIRSFDIWTDAQGIKSKGRVKSIDNISLEGINHLREMILNLAIRGKLIAQNPKFANHTTSSRTTLLRSDHAAPRRAVVTNSMSATIDKHVPSMGKVSFERES